MSEPQPNRRQEILVAAAAVSGLALLVFAGLAGWLSAEFRLESGRLEAILRIVGLLGAVLLGCWLYARKRDWLPRDKPVQDRVGRPDLAWLRELRENSIDLAARTDPAAVAVFVEMLLDPVRYRPRVVEKIDLGGALITQRVTVELQLPAAAAKAPRLYLPVLRPRKWELLDNFHLNDAAGTSLPDLSYQELMALSGVGLRLLFSEAFAEHQRRLRSEEVQAVELALLGLLAIRDRRAVGAIESDVERILSRIDFTDATPGSRERISVYVVTLACAHPVTAVVPAGAAETSRLLVKYERTIVPYLLTRGWQGLLRMWFNLKPNKVAIPAELALTTRSYHLRVTVPPDMFILRQFLQCRHCRQLVTLRWRGRVPTPDNPCAHERDPNGNAGKDPSTLGLRLRVRRRRGQNFANVSMRGFGTGTPRMLDLQLLASFYEAPPGAGGRAAVTALVTTVLLLTVGNLAGEIAGTSEAVPALLLALPAVAASWFGATAENEDFLGGSLAARFSLIASGLVSALAVLVYVKATANGEPAQGGQVNFLGVHNTLMYLLCIVSAVNFVFTGYRYFLHMQHYNHLIRRKNVPEPEAALEI